MERIIKIQKEILALETYYPHRVRVVVEELSFGFSIFFLSFSVLFVLPISSEFSGLWPVFQGLFLISFALLLDSLLIEVYFQSLHRRLSRLGGSFPVVIIKHYADKRGDTAHALFNLGWGGGVAKNLGIAHEQVQHFLYTKQPLIVIPIHRHLLHDFGNHVYEQDPEFRNFLTSVSVDKEHLVDVLRMFEINFNKNLKSRLLFHPLFSNEKPRAYTFEELIRLDIEDVEFMHSVHFTHQAIVNIILHFKENRFDFISSLSRKELLTDIIEHSLRLHDNMSHGRRVILPADTRLFFITHKAKTI
jgi:hypothetical protein